jgi:hypothetical protein
MMTNPAIRIVATTRVICWGIKSVSIATTTGKKTQSRTRGAFIPGKNIPGKKSEQKSAATVANQKDKIVAA